MYGVIVPNFILLGGDGYKVLKDNAKQDHIVGKSRELVLILARLR
jgi:hypothetical protein